MPRPTSSSSTAERVNGACEERGEEISLLSWLELTQGFVADTADLLKDELESIKKRKIVRNERTLKNEKKPETVRLSKNIVAGFNDAIAKAVRQLQNYGLQMTEELQRRFNLPDDWMLSSSTTVSVSGSEINGPVAGLRKREMDSRINSYLKDRKCDGLQSETSRRSGLDSESETSNEAAHVKGGNMSTVNTHEDVESETVPEKIQPNKNILNNDKSTPKKSAKQGASTPQKKYASPQKAPSSKSSDSDEPEDQNLGDDEVDVVPGTDDDNDENLNEPVQSSGKIDAGKAPNSGETNKTDVCTTPRKNTQESCSSGSNSRKKETPRKDFSPEQPEADDDEDADSDESNRTCIVPTTKSLIPIKKPSAKEIKKERKSDASEMEKNSSIGKTKDKPEPVKKQVKREPVDPEDNMDESNADPTHMDVDDQTSAHHDGRVPDDDEEDIMDFLTPPQGEAATGYDGGQTDNVANILKITTSTEPTLQASEKEESGSDNENKANHTSMGSDDKEQPRKSNKRKESSVKPNKEDLAAMKDLMDSTDSESSSQRQKRLVKRSPRKAEARSTKKVSEKRALETTSEKTWKDDPKLKPNAAVVRLERLLPAIVNSVNTNGYVALKEYKALKRRSLKELENENDSSDSSTASDDSLKAFDKALKKLVKSSIVNSMKYNKKKKVSLGDKRTRKSGIRKNGTDHNELNSSDSDNDSDVIVRNCATKPELVNSDIASCSGSEDLDAASDESTSKNKQKGTRSNPSRQREGKRKNYKQATLSGSDSDKEVMKEIMGSDSDSSSTKKSKKKSKKFQDNSDSDSDFVSTKKKVNKRVLKGSDSESSVITIKTDSSSDSDSDFKSSKKSSKRRRDSSPESKKRKKRRKRIVTNDSDDSKPAASSGSDIEEIPQEPGSSQKGRKNIRKIMSTKELAKTTKEAEKEEEERRKRLTEKQKMFNGIHQAPESDKIERLVLDIDAETKEPLIEVDESIVQHLKPHQAEGIKFMYNACFESVDMIKQKKVPGGCILAHCMGLGKTLQTIAFVHTLLTTQICEIKTALVICPLSTVSNWFLEFRKWTEDAKDIKIHKLYEAKNDSSRIDYFKTWQRRGGVGLLHYDMFRRLADPKGKTKMKPSLKAVIQESLLDPGPDIVICDEGHLLKNCKSMLSLAVSNIRTHRRIVLTGTPLQNNLVEYHTMMNFVKPNLLGSLQEFTNRFVNPIKNGQHADSTDYDVKTMKRRAHVLHRKLEGCVQRRDYSILAPYLPPKYEYIINIKLSEKQESLYKHYLNSVVEPDPQVRRRHLLKYYAELVKVWSHPIALTMRRRKEEGSTSDDDSIKDFINDEKSTTSGSESGAEGKSDNPKPSSSSSNSKRTTRAQAANDPDWDKGNINLEDAIGAGGWWNAIFKSKDEMSDVTLSGKLIILQEILKTCEAIGDKVLVFSQFLTSLDIIEEFLNNWDSEAENAQKEPITFPISSAPQPGRWRKNIEYFRIDGQTKAEDRQRDCDKFNKKSSLSRAKLFLISTRAGGLGINLYGANRVVIFDASWNPSQDMQSIFRVYRFGQDKPCYIYRLIARGTMEEKILRRQITKLSLSSRVIDEHQIERHFKFDDVNEMYQYDEEDPATKDVVLAVPKDRLLADLVMSHREWIRGYEEFDSLLENKPDEGLSNEEKELAWAEYRIESEKRQTMHPSNVRSEAETYLKVKARITTNHPHASEGQIDHATRTCLEVIDKIRRLVHLTNLYHAQAPYIALQLDPLKTWLQAAVNPRDPSPSIPQNESILPPLPEEFSQPDPAVSYPTYQPRPASMQYQQRYTQPPRPPMFRNAPPLRPMAPGPSPLLLQNNFRHIASSTLQSLQNVRNYPYPQQQ